MLDTLTAAATGAIAGLLGFPWLRIAYSALMIAAASALLLEAGRVWRAPPTELGGFAYYLDGKADDGRGQGLRAQVRHYHQRLLALIRAEAARDKALDDARTARIQPAANQPANQPGQQPANQPAGAAPIHPQVQDWSAGASPLGASSDRLAELDLTLQGVNVSKIGSMLRRAVTARDEITGVFSRTDAGVVSTVSWPQAPTPDGETYNVTGAETDDALAFDIAGALLWTAAVGHGGARLANVSRDELIGWMRALGPFAAARDRVEAGHAIGADDRRTLAAARDDLGRMIAAGADFAEIYRLRAAIARLLYQPGGPEDREATGDLIIYNALLAGNTLEDARKAAAAAQATQVAAAPTNTLPSLGSLFTHFAAGQTLRTFDVAGAKTLASPGPETDVAAGTALARLVAAVGYVRNRATPYPFSGTGFVIAPGVVATATFVLGPEPRAIGPIAPGRPVDFVVADRLGATGSAVYPATETLAVLGDVTLLRVPGVAGAIAPIAIAAPPADGAPLSVIAFGGREGLRGVALGKLLDAEGETLRYDAPTEAGSSGAPVIAADGAAVALHIGSTAAGAATGTAAPGAATGTAARGAATGTSAPGAATGTGVALAAAIPDAVAAQFGIQRR